MDWYIKLSMDRNPYDPPKSNLEQSAPPPGALELAPRGLRFANLVIDSVAHTLVVIALFAFVASSDPELMKRIAADDSPLNAYIIGVCVALLYYVPQESLFGWTLGKLVTRTRVVDEAGNRPTFGRVLGRTLLRFVPFEAFTFLGELGLHDRASGTRVVRIPQIV